MSGIALWRVIRCVNGAAVFLGAVAAVPAQTPFTWTGGAESTNWFAPDNWNPVGPPGASGSSANTDQALFATAGTSVSANNLNSGFSLGAIATTGATGGTLTATFNGNGPLRLNGGYTVGPFANVAAAAQNGRDLDIMLTNMSFAFGQNGSDTTFFADANRTISIATQQITNSGNNLVKEGAGTLILGGAPGLQRELSNKAINIHGGVLAAHHSFNNLTQITVSSGASIQPGLSTGGDTLSTSAPIIFANDAGLRIPTNGTVVNQLQNAAMSKAPGDTFRIVLAGLPSIAETYTPNGIIVQASSLTGFDPNGTYTPSSPGHFSLLGDGFLITDWSLTVLNGTQIRLDSMTVAPVPEPAWILVANAWLLGLRISRRRR